MLLEEPHVCMDFVALEQELIVITNCTFLNYLLQKIFLNFIHVIYIIMIIQLTQ